MNFALKMIVVVRQGHLGQRGHAVGPHVRGLPGRRYRPGHELSPRFPAQIPRQPKVFQLPGR